MHFYWRVIEELRSIGENWIIHDPSLKRNYQQWLQRNMEAIVLSANNEKGIVDAKRADRREDGNL